MVHLIQESSAGLIRKRAQLAEQMGRHHPREDSGSRGNLFPALGLKVDAGDCGWRKVQVSSADEQICSGRQRRFMADYQEHSGRSRFLMNLGENTSDALAVKRCG